MKKILITGGTGFIGANFVHTFSARGEEVHVLKRKESSIDRIGDIKNRLFFHDVELSDTVRLEAILKEIKPDHILHFAAYGTHQDVEQDIQKTIETNLLGTINLLNTCAKIGFSSFINTGSTSEYGRKEHPMKETDVLEPNNLYGVTKAAGTLYCEQFGKKNDLPIVTMRLFSIFGYRESYNRLIPTLGRAVLLGEELKAISPSTVRDFIFIEDVISAYLKAMDMIDTVKGNIFNIASGEELSIADVVKTAEKVSGKRIKVSYGDFLAKQVEPEHWVGNIEKAREMLGWSPSHTFEEGFSKFLDWVKAAEKNRTTV